MQLPQHCNINVYALYNFVYRVSILLSHVTFKIIIVIDSFLCAHFSNCIRILQNNISGCWKVG